jgi:hypothetical protein
MSAWREAFEFAEVALPIFVSYDARVFPRIPAHALVIMDESQYVKNRDSKRWKRLLPSLRATRNRLLLTGTPMLNRHAELWTQLRLLAYEGSWMHFVERYCGARMRTIRRRGRSIRMLDTSGSTRSKELHALTLECSDVMRAYQLAAPIRARSAAWRAAIVKAAVGNVVIFARHVCVLDALAELFPRAARIDGTRRDAIPESGVILCSIGAAAVGLTLTFASLCVFAECSWSAGIQMQCEARIHRIGQTRACEFVYVLFGHADDAIWSSLQRKERVVRALTKRN